MEANDDDTNFDTDLDDEETGMVGRFYLNI